MQGHDQVCVSPGPPTLDTLNEDVLRLIMDHFNVAPDLRNLASTSQKLRAICRPVLFSRCKVDIRRRVDYLPEQTSIHVRHLTHLGPLGNDQDIKYFQALLRGLPSLQSITIKDTSGHIPWGIWKTCLSRSPIESLSYDAGYDDLAIPPFPSDEVEGTHVSLQRFSYTTTTWREWTNGTEVVRGDGRRPISMRPVFESERDCLSNIVLRMNETGVSLTLPLESTPLLAMAELSWPNLKELNLHGRFLDAPQVTHLQHLLRSLPSLVRLSILAARTSEVGRPPFLPNPASPQLSSARLPSVPPSNPEPFSEDLLPHLRTLEIAYPDPMDGLFSVPMPKLTRLALRDQPRLYHNRTRGSRVLEGPMMEHWHTPILRDFELLSVLRRMELPLLTSLEVAYGVMSEDCDHELLSYIVDAFPHLEHLELHRYRHRWRILTTRHKLVAEILSRARSLRTVRLNLDFHDDSQTYCGNAFYRGRWLERLQNERGPEIVEAMQACPFLEHVAILYHGLPSSIWVEFHPSRGVGEAPRFVMSYDEAHVVSEMIRRRWDRPNHAYW